MKRLLVAILAASLCLAGCSSPVTLRINGSDKVYPNYGLFDEGEHKSQYVCYELDQMNVVWGVVFVETIVIPLVIIGWYLYKPVRAKRDASDSCGGIDG